MLIIELAIEKLTIESLNSLITPPSSQKKSSLSFGVSSMYSCCIVVIASLIFC
jgi:hypothetical protein